MGAVGKRVYVCTCARACNEDEMGRARELEASWLIMIDSFRTHSSSPLAPSLQLPFSGLITETDLSFPPLLLPSSPPFLRVSLHQTPPFPPPPTSPRWFIHTSLWKRGCQSPSDASPSSNRLHLPSTHPSLRLLPFHLRHSGLVFFFFTHPCLPLTRPSALISPFASKVSSTVSGMKRGVSFRRTGPELQEPPVLVLWKTFGHKKK